MGFSLPNHDAKDWKGHTEKRQKKKKINKQKKKNKENPRADCIRQGQSTRKKNNLYDACSNALRTTQLDFKKHRICLNIEFITKIPNFENPLSKNPTN